jgi:hypothetical protein
VMSKVVGARRLCADRGVKLRVEVLASHSRDAGPAHPRKGVIE